MKKEIKELSIYELLRYMSLIFFLIAVIGIVGQFVSISIVSGNSMNNTLTNGEKCIILKAVHPQKGDIVCCVTTDTGYEAENTYNDEYVVKRIIATEGDTIEIKDNTVYINDEAIEESYAIGTMDDMAKLTVGAGQIFIMGDNREHSWDSRKIGTIPEKNIVGKVVEK